MEACRLGNLDLLLYITKKELSKIEKIIGGKEVVIASARIKSAPQDPIGGKEIQLIYNQKRDIDCGLDCTEIVSHLMNPPIPVYISDRGLLILCQGDYCGSAFLSYKLSIKIKE